MIDPLPANPNAEQAESAIADLAWLVASYLLALMQRGVPPAYALQLARDYQQQLLIGRS